MVIFGIVNRDAYNQLILLIKRLRADKNSFWVLVDLERQWHSFSERSHSVKDLNL